MAGCHACPMLLHCVAGAGCWVGFPKRQRGEWFHPAPRYNPALLFYQKLRRYLYGM